MGKKIKELPNCNKRQQIRLYAHLLGCIVHNKVLEGAMYEFVSERRKGLLLSLGNSYNTHLVATKWCLLSEMTWWIIIRNVGSRLGGCKCLGFAPGMIKKTSIMAHWLTHIRSPRNHPHVYSWCWVSAQTDIFMIQCTIHISSSLSSQGFMKDIPISHVQRSYVVNVVGLRMDWSFTSVVYVLSTILCS